MINREKVLRIVLVIIFGLSSLFFILNNISRYWDGVRVDFPSFYYAAELAINGLSPYKNGIWESTKSLNLPDQELYPFLNLPFSLILFFPLTLAEFQVSQTILLIFNITAAFLLIYLVFNRILKKPLLDPFFLIGGVLVLFFPPVRETISHGQVNLIVILLICTFWWAIKENKSSLLAGLPLALSILLKVYPGIFLLYLFIKKEYKTIALTVGIIALFALAAFLLLPTDIWGDWYSTVGRIKYGGVFANKIPSWKVGNQSLNGFITRFFLGARNRGIPSISDFIYPMNWLKKRISALVWGYLSVGFLVLAWMYLIIKNWKNGITETDSDIELSMLLLTMYLIAPISWDHHLVFIIPSIFVLLDHYIHKKSFGVSFWFMIILAGLLFIDFDLKHPFYQRGALGILVSIQFFSVLGLWFSYFVAIYKSTRILELESG